MISDKNMADKSAENTTSFPQRFSRQVFFVTMISFFCFSVPSILFSEQSKNDSDKKTQQQVELHLSPPAFPVPQELGSQIVSDDAGKPISGKSTCGNGIVEPGETCDDNNTIAGDGCSATCQSENASCGNGKIETNEECGEPGLSACIEPRTCQSCRCLLPPLPFCNNGKIEAGEECGEPGLTPCSAGKYCQGCRCVDVVGICGNGVAEADEECGEPGLTCNSGFVCQPGTCRCVSPNGCQSNDQCDDGNSCTEDVCDPATGACSHTAMPDATPCDDTNACTEPDVCVGGICQGQQKNCADDLFCNGVETCDPAKGCVPGKPPCPADYCNEASDQCPCGYVDCSDSRCHVPYCFKENGNCFFTGPPESSGNSSQSASISGSQDVSQCCVQVNYVINYEYDVCTGEVAGSPSVQQVTPSPGSCTCPVIEPGGGQNGNGGMPGCEEAVDVSTIVVIDSSSGNIPKITVDCKDCCGMSRHVEVPLTAPADKPPVQCSVQCPGNSK